jgi:hypothetical protein
LSFIQGLKYKWISAQEPKQMIRYKNLINTALGLGLVRLKLGWILCVPFSRASPLVRRATKEGHSQIPLSVHFVSFIMIMDAHLGFFLEIVETLRFRWAQTPTVNYLGLSPSRHLLDL